MVAYQDCVAQLSNYVLRRGIHYSLDNFSKALAALGNPQYRLPLTVHVAGTNGKGSTVAYLAAMLQASGKSVGTYTSPHLFSYTERFSLNATAISEAVFASYFLRVQASPFSADLSEFEFLTAMAFLYFSDTASDVLILETGLGGRLDATNLAPAAIAIITQIGLDHQVILGRTLAEIADEKAGIMKKGQTVFLLSQSPHLMKRFETMAEKVSADLNRVKPFLKWPADAGMRQPVQKKNAALAWAAAKKLGCSEADMQGAIRQVRLPGRMSERQYQGRSIFIDVAHNPQAIRALVAALQFRWPKHRFQIVIGFQMNRPILGMLQPFRALDAAVFYCDFSPGLSMPKASVQRVFSWVQDYALPDSLPNSDSEVITIVTGSFYFVTHFLGAL